MNPPTKTVIRMVDRNTTVRRNLIVLFTGSIYNTSLSLAPFEMQLWLNYLEIRFLFFIEKAYQCLLYRKDYFTA
jgi:hypothetical protein